ncbi:MAG: acyl carrier protein [Bacteroidales bacterium]|nr:acyl carrier protein [Bacteroidales bacterium]MBK9357035.1 acyl carrier protein [Bacteroidales bacterium]
MKPEIVAKVNEFLAEEFEIETALLTPEARLVEDLGIESLDFVDIVVIIERDFGFKVKREDMEGVRTLEDLYKYIETRAV